MVKSLVGQIIIPLVGTRGGDWQIEGSFLGIFRTKVLFEKSYELISKRGAVIVARKMNSLQIVEVEQGGKSLAEICCTLKYTFCFAF